MRPGGIHIAYILGRKDSYLLMFSANKLKEQLKFQVGYVRAYYTQPETRKLLQVCYHQADIRLAPA